ncbi:MAG TPA: hypothetical protein VFD16_00590 [Candidatus Saccharimonadales bacterium]|nr:hypothetical protein [Candidatus Saccharimonadales bacterium]
MENKLWEDPYFGWIFLASIVVAILYAVFANTGSFIKDVLAGLVIGLICLVAVSSAFMPKC